MVWWVSSVSKVSMPKERWVGFIKDYDGGTLMECRINQKVRGGVHPLSDDCK